MGCIAWLCCDLCDGRVCTMLCALWCYPCVVFVILGLIKCPRSHQRPPMQMYLQKRQPRHMASLRLWPVGSSLSPNCTLNGMYISG